MTSEQEQDLNSREQRADVTVPPSLTGTARGMLPKQAPHKEDIEIELVLVQCPECHAHLGADISFLDQQVREWVWCPCCGTRIHLPEDEPDATS